MSRLGSIAAIAIFSLVYASIGLMIGLASGFIVMKLVGLAARTDLVFTVPAQAIVAIWALGLAIAAVLVYLRSPSDRPGSEPPL